MTIYDIVKIYRKYYKYNVYFNVIVRLIMKRNMQCYRKTLSGIQIIYLGEW